MPIAPGLRSVNFSMCNDVQLQLAQDSDHYLGAFRLVHDSYCRTGLSRPNEFGLRVTPHQLAEDSRVFVATLDGEVISTQSLVLDGEAGLPLESVYPREIEERRSQGLRLAEVTCLADRRLSPKRFFSLFCELSRLMAQYAERQNVDEIWIACHPRHAPLYERRLAFSRHGNLTEHPSVLGSPAVPLRLDLRRLPESHPTIWRRFFGESIPSDVFVTDPIPADDREYYAAIAQACEQTNDKSNFLVQAA